jgi:hypothetical protein
MSNHSMQRMTALMWIGPRRKSYEVVSLVLRP